MASKFNIAFTVNDAAATAKSKLDVSGTASPVRCLNRLIGYLSQMVNGSTSLSAVVQTTAVAASGTVTFSSFADGDTVTIGQVVSTGRTTPTLSTEFAVGNGGTTCASNFATFLSTNTTLNKFVSGSASSSTVTITATVPGVIGNQLALAISAHGSVSGAVFTGGSSDSPVTISHGL